MKKLFLFFCVSLALLPAALSAQSGEGRIITGKVTDEKGEPLIGAGVMVKNGNGGAR